MYISTVKHLGMVHMVGNMLELEMMLDVLGKLDNNKLNYIRIYTDESTRPNDICSIVVRVSRPNGYGILGDMYPLVADIREWRKYNKHIEVKPKTMSDRLTVWRYVEGNINKMGGHADA